MRTPSRPELLKRALGAARSDRPHPNDVARWQQAAAKKAVLAGTLSAASLEAGSSAAASLEAGAGVLGPGSVVVTGGVGTASGAAAGSTAIAAVGSLAKLGGVTKGLIAVGLGLGCLGGGSLAYRALSATPGSVEVEVGSAPLTSGEPRAAAGQSLRGPSQAEPGAPPALGMLQVRAGGDTAKGASKAPARRARSELSEAHGASLTEAHRASPAESLGVSDAGRGAGPQPRAPASAPGSSSKTSEALREATLIESARRLVGRTPSEALVLLERHSTEFPAGALSVERRVLTIEALHRLGRQGEARAALDAFRTDYPASVYQRRLDALTEKSSP